MGNTSLNSGRIFDRSKASIIRSTQVARKNLSRQIAELEHQDIRATIIAYEDRVKRSLELLSDSSIIFLQQCLPELFSRTFLKNDRRWDIPNIDIKSSGQLLFSACRLYNTESSEYMCYMLDVAEMKCAKKHRKFFDYQWDITGAIIPLTECLDFEYTTLFRHVCEIHGLSNGDLSNGDFEDNYKTVGSHYSQLTIYGIDPDEIEVADDIICEAISQKLRELSLSPDIGFLDTLDILSVVATEYTPMHLNF